MKLWVLFNPQFAEKLSMNEPLQLALRVTNTDVIVMHFNSEKDLSKS